MPHSWLRNGHGTPTHALWRRYALEKDFEIKEFVHIWVATPRANESSAFLDIPPSAVLNKETRFIAGFID
jgi:hypothetical protein